MRDRKADGAEQHNEKVGQTVTFHEWALDSMTFEARADLRETIVAG